MRKATFFKIAGKQTELLKLAGFVVIGLTVTKEGTTLQSG